MNTKLLMTISAIMMGLAGITLSFLPNEILNYFQIDGTIINMVTLQVLGALYFGFAMVNWTAKANLIGGIYARPIAIGNLTHFVVGMFAVIKAYAVSHEKVLLIAGIIYLIFAASFSFVFFTHPVKKEQ